MELSGSTLKGATRPVTGPPLWRSPEVSDPQDPVAEIRGGSYAATEHGPKQASPLQNKTFLVIELNGF